MVSFTFITAGDCAGLLPTSLHLVLRAAGVTCTKLTLTWSEKPATSRPLSSRNAIDFAPRELCSAENLAWRALNAASWAVTVCHRSRLQSADSALVPMFGECIPDAVKAKRPGSESSGTRYGAGARPVYSRTGVRVSRLTMPLVQCIAGVSQVGSRAAALCHVSL